MHELPLLFGWRLCLQVIPQHLLANQAALKEYNDAILMQRNKMGEELEQKAEEVEIERQKREEIAQRLALLQSKVRLALLGMRVRVIGLSAVRCHHGRCRCSVL